MVTTTKSKKSPAKKGVGKAGKLTKPAMPVFTGRYASIRKRIWKNWMNAYWPPEPGKKMSIGGKIYKSEQGYRTALINRVNAELKKIDKAENAVLPNEIEIEVGYAKGSMGAMQATAKMKWHDQNGFHHVTGEKTRGYGYDKKSTAVSYVLDDVPFGQKIALEIARLSNPPYGIGGTSKSSINAPYWDGGVGMGSFTGIFEKVGYTYKHYGSDRYDVYVFTRGRSRKS